MSRSGFAAIVGRHWPDTTGYLVVGRDPCIRIAKEETRHVRRRFVLVSLEDVEGTTPDGSWFMAVIVCAGDDLAALSGWALGQDPARIHFYLHSGADPRLLVPWRDRGLPLDRVDMGFTDWRSLHKVLGRDLNNRVFDDHHRAPA